MIPFILLCSCESYLDVKPDKALVVPTTLEDFQALLDNDRQMLNQDLALQFMGADNHYLPDGTWRSLFNNVERNAYIWAPDIFEGEPGYDWNLAYEQVFIANVVLDGLGEVEVTDANRAQWEQLRGSALFFRSYAFYNLLQLFAEPYDPATAAQHPGIPLRLTSNINAPVSRAGLQECYDEVLSSLQEATALLPESSGYKTRPDRAAAHGFLARVHLAMQGYGQALQHADAYMALHNGLMDYNGLDTAAVLPFEQFNGEVSFHSVMTSFAIVRSSFVDPGLYAQYAEEDLRKHLFFEEGTDGSIVFKGTYSGQGNFFFSGIATDEVYLIRAECKVRLGDVSGALGDLNTLLETRWQTGTYEPVAVPNAEGALEVVLRERRKELLFRGLRWADLRRLNQEPDYAQTLERTVDGEAYSLPPNDPRYVYPIPPLEVEVSGIGQNPR